MDAGHQPSAFKSSTGSSTLQLPWHAAVAAVLAAAHALLAQGSSGSGDRVIVPCAFSGSVSRKFAPSPGAPQACSHPPCSSLERHKAIWLQCTWLSLLLRQQWPPLLLIPLRKGLLVLLPALLVMLLCWLQIPCLWHAL